MKFESLLKLLGGVWNPFFLLWLVEKSLLPDSCRTWSVLTTRKWSPASFTVTIHYITVFHSLSPQLAGSLCMAVRDKLNLFDFCWVPKAASGFIRTRWSWALTSSSSNCCTFPHSPSILWLILCVDTRSRIQRRTRPTNILEDTHYNRKCVTTT